MKYVIIVSWLILNATYGMTVLIITTLILLLTQKQHLFTKLLLEHTDDVVYHQLNFCNALVLITEVYLY